MFQLLNFTGHFKAAQTPCDIRLHAAASFDKFVNAVYCVNFIVFLRVILKIFSLSFVTFVSPPRTGNWTFRIPWTIRTTTGLFVPFIFYHLRRANSGQKPPEIELECIDIYIVRG